MKADEKAKWNKRYETGPPLPKAPEPFLAKSFQQFLATHPPGSALDVAGGAGRHALWLAQRGWRVKLIDIAEAAVAHALENAARIIPQPVSCSAEPLLIAEVVDLNSSLDLGSEQYDLVLVFLYLQRRLFPVLVRALKPGGLLIYETYTIERQTLGGGPANPAYLLEPVELLRAFQTIEILDYREDHLKGTAELVARKPAL
jgi:SAM-dependent methyltransferase